MVRVKVTFYFGLGDLFGSETKDVELTEGTTTIRALLNQLCDSEERRYALFGATGSINPLISILKNGKNTSKLDTVLRDGDWIDLFPGLSGG